MLLSLARSSGSALSPHVGRVHGGSSEKQVRGIHARRVIAAVKDRLAFRDRSYREFPCDPMGTALIELPVARRLIPGCLPFPAVARVTLVDFLPEAFSYRA